MILVGTVFKLAYNLHRHRWLGWPLAYWFGFLLLAGGVAVSIRAWPAPGHAVTSGVLFLAYVAFLAWAVQWGFLVFEDLPLSAGAHGQSSRTATLVAEEMVPVWVSGLFTVQGKVRYFVDLEADFQTTALNEHIIMARVPRSRFLLVGQWPEGDVGWWYMFFRPESVRELAVGRLHYGLRRYDALRVVLAETPDAEQTVFMAFSDGDVRCRVQAHLQRLAPLVTAQGLRESDRQSGFEAG